MCENAGETACANLEPIGLGGTGFSLSFERGTSMKKPMLVTAALVTAALLLILSACNPASNKPPDKISVQPFGKAGSAAVDLYTLRNTKGLEVSITNYGGIITSIKVADKLGRTDDVVLGFDSLEGYLSEHPYFGALIGRYGNRIGQARFKLDG